MRIAIFLFLASIALLPVHAKEAPLVFMGDEEPAMQRAFEKARATLDDFLKLAAQPPPQLDLFSLKVGITDGGRTEYFWIGDFKRRGDRFEGRIDNTPQMIKTVRLGQIYEFGRGQIVDWMYLDRPKRKMMGNFTFCALLSKEPPAKAAAQRRQYNLDCD